VAVPFQLNRHLRCNAHTKRTQLRNGFNAYRKANALTKLPCILCLTEGTVKEYVDSNAWLKHIAKHHPEELWEAGKGNEEVDDDD
jgi:hypothetical protein